MQNKWNKLLLLILSVFMHQTNAASEKILIERYENWDHPVLTVFQKNNLSLYKISYSSDEKCPTFYVRWFEWALKDTDHYQKMYEELLKANYNFPYALVSQEENIKVNVGWQNRAKKTVLVESGTASSPSTCRYDLSANTSKKDFSKMPCDALMLGLIRDSSFNKIFSDKKLALVFGFERHEREIGITFSHKVEGRRNNGVYANLLLDLDKQTLVDMNPTPRVPIAINRNYVPFIAYKCTPEENMYVNTAKHPDDDREF